MAVDDNHLEVQPPLRNPPIFLEVLCTISGKTRRFAAGTKASFALLVINDKLGGGSRVKLIEATKEGEEPITFCPCTILVDYGSGWRLQAVTAPEGYSVRSSMAPSPIFVEVTCRSSGEKSRFIDGTEAGYALSWINFNLGGGSRLRHIEALKEGEEPIILSPNSLLKEYGDGWHFQAVFKSEGEPFVRPARAPPLQFVEVTCTSSGKKRRFTAGTQARVALMEISRLEGGSRVRHIVATKEGEVPIIFSRKSVLIGPGDGWHLQAVSEPEGLNGVPFRPSTRASPLIFPHVSPPVKQQQQPQPQPNISFSYIAKILLAFVLIFVMGAAFTLALENLPRLILYINSVNSSL